MDKKFEQILEEICNTDFVDGIISNATKATDITKIKICLLYTSDAADE